ncbi:hypothetical protein [Oleomonas cavernae]|uniref:hypothetical protein n=1 Tax=Oleomonas cavernae TaxID=2320859 RepID=UPI0018F4B143|nr:hypothetical protein [Oleomonas cavernae]
MTVHSDQLAKLLEEPVRKPLIDAALLAKAGAWLKRKAINLAPPVVMLILLFGLWEILCRGPVPPCRPPPRSSPIPGN